MSLALYRSPKSAYSYSSLSRKVYVQKKITGPLLSLGLLWLSGCGNLDAEILSTATNPGLSLTIPLESKVLPVGSTWTVTPTQALPPLTYQSTSSGYFDHTTGVFTVPTNAKVISEVVTVTDSTGKLYQVKVQVRGFAEHAEVALPQGADDQNYPTDAVWLDSGEILVSAIGSDAMGERWVIYRSADEGLNWDRVDHFMGVEYEGESHPLSMAATGSTVYTCGYAYSYNAGASDPNSVWMVRKSIDKGTTWTTVDEWWDSPGDNHVCYDIAIAPGTGYLYTVGYSINDWVIRESRDQGASWQELYRAQPAAGAGQHVAFQVAVSPDGRVWVMGQSGASRLYFMRGQETAGTWSWTPITNGVPAVIPYGNYQLRGTLRVLDNSTAYYSYRNPTSNAGQILKTTDGGDTWASVYLGQTYLQGFTLTSNGTLLASGGRSSATEDWKVIRSTDSGSSWTPLDLDSLLGATKKPAGLPIVAHPTQGKVLAFAYNRTGYQISTALSTDHGATWTARSEVKFVWSFWGNIEKMVRHSSGALYAIVFFGDMDGEWPWAVQKSLDDGKTWSTVDLQYGTSSQHPRDIAIGHDGALYVAGNIDSNYILRRSVDGSNWSTVWTDPVVGWSGGQFLRRLGNQETFLISTGGSGAPRVLSSTDGSTWSLKSTIPIPGGVNQLAVLDFDLDGSGHLWVVVNEQISAGNLKTTVLLRSIDGGLNWAEVKRGTQISGWNVRGELKFDPQGHLFFWDAVTLQKSADNGQNWNAVTLPAGAINLEWTWLEGQLFFATVSPFGSGGHVLSTYDETTSSWTVWEDAEARRPEMKLLNREEYDWGWPGSFFEVGPTEVYVNHYFNDPYYGTKVLLRKLKTAD